MTGATGYLGAHVVADPQTDRCEVVAPSSRSLDLRNAESVVDAVRAWRPTAIVHTAYRRDDRETIVDASRNVARAAAACGARLVHVSTDVVFKGQLAPYAEHEQPTPITSYGTDKADAEAAVREACPAAVVARTSLLVAGGRDGAQEQLVADVVRGDSDVGFFTDEVRCPVIVDDVAAALVALALDPSAGGIVHLGGPDAIDRHELALLIARRHGWPVDRIRPATLRASGLLRPSRVVLDSSRARALGLSLRGPYSWTSAEGDGWVSSPTS